MDLSFLKIMNPWWEHPDLVKEDPDLKVRREPYYYDSPLKAQIKLKSGQGIILRGPRQVGKTTLLKEKIFEAIDDRKIAAKRCLYLYCESIASFQELQKILVTWLKPYASQATLICLDEISFVPEWRRAMLWLFNAGLLKKATALITGSNARDLKESGERFPGRPIRELSIYPLSFAEYTRLPCFQAYVPQKLLSVYLQVGGFPRAVADYYRHSQVTDETYQIYLNWIFSDAHRFELNREILTHLLFRIFETSASQITWQRLIEKSPIKSHETALAYVEHLESAFLCKTLHCYDPEKDMAAPRKAKKLYLVDPLLYVLAGGFLKGVRNNFVWWKQKIDDASFRVKIFESVVVTQMMRSMVRPYYWYSTTKKQEVDLLSAAGDERQLLDVKLKPHKARLALGQQVRVVTPEEFVNPNLFLFYHQAATMF